MKIKFNISVPTPCSEDWNKFTPSENGRFCGSCQKTVVDFTKMSESEIISFMSARPANTCGRFYNHQLREYRLMPPMKLNPGFTVLKAGLLGMLSLFVSKVSLAQSNSHPSQIEVAKSKANIPGDKTPRTIKGKVVSIEDGSPYPGVNVVLKGSTTGIATDADGKFEFPEKLKDGDVLVFSFIGLKSYEHIILGNRSVEISMEPDVTQLSGELVITGGLSVDGVYSPEPRGIKRMWSKIKSIF